MIKIECTKKPNMSYPLLVDKTYVVGRKSGDITFPDDQSISRTHAELIVEHPQGNICEPMLTPVLVITDVGSK
ncbi:Nibrin, partial [Orchesella cincta]